VDLFLTVLLGLALAFALAIIVGRLAHGRVPRLPRHADVLWTSADGVAALVSLLLAAATLALLPWPLHPAAGRTLVGQPLVIWAALEGAFLVPLLPALLAPSPLAARAASREAQINAAGHCVVWLACVVALAAGGTIEELPGRVLLLLGASLALPAAVGLGPFAPERSLSPAGAEEGLDDDTARLLGFARITRSAALLAVWSLAVVALAGRPGDTLPFPGPMLIAALALVAVAALILGRYGAERPLRTLPAALRWCWWRALPLALAGIVYLTVV
jgi:hypothetical protein